MTCADAGWQLLWEIYHGTRETHRVRVPLVTLEDLERCQGARFCGLRSEPTRAGLIYILRNDLFDFLVEHGAHHRKVFLAVGAEAA